MVNLLLPSTDRVMSPDHSSSAAPSSQVGRLVVISGPSGAGKTTLLRHLFAESELPLARSVSATTRAPRPGEVEGVDYFFLTPSEFERRRLAGEFLECFEVYGRGHWYGTLKSEVAPSLEAGKWVVLEIDVQGAQAVLREFPDAVTIFVLPGDIAELERRLVRRGTESEEVRAQRLEAARREISFADQYRFRVVNERLEQAVGDICKILRQQRDTLN